MIHFNYDEGYGYKLISFYAEEYDTDFCIDICFDKATEETTVECCHCGRGRGDVWTEPEVYETSNEPFLIVAQRWIRIYGNTSRWRIGSKESW